jgi:hypothetical protein
VSDEDHILIRCLVRRLLSAPASGDDNAIYSQGKARIFAVLCNVLEIDYTHVDLARKSAKRVLYDSILGLVGTEVHYAYRQLTFVCQITTNPSKATVKLKSFLARLDSRSANGDTTDDEMKKAEVLAENQGQHTLPERDGVDLQATKRVIRRLMRTNLEDAADLDLVFAQGSTAIFAYICNLLHLDYDAEIGGQATKRIIFNYLITSVSGGHKALKSC